MVTTNTNDFKSRKLLLDPIVELLLRKKISHPQGRLGHQEIKKVLDDYSECYPWITKGMLTG
jgi:hypothetical protein